MLDEAAVRAASAQYPLPAGFKPSYGTAGFRCASDLMASTTFRCGLLVAVRALATGRACGIMITASHNPECDNGVKLVDPSGEMLDAAWEAHATALARAEDDDALVAALAALSAAHPPAHQPAHRARVVIGRDTRPSGAALAAACAAGVQAMGLHVTDAGMVTTPELHYGVWVSETRDPPGDTDVRPHVRIKSVGQRVAQPAAAAWRRPRPPWQTRVRGTDGPGRH